VTGEEYDDAANNSPAKIEGTDVHEVETSTFGNEMTQKETNPAENDIDNQFPETPIFPKMEDSPKQGCQNPSKNVGSNVHKPSLIVSDLLNRPTLTIPARRSAWLVVPNFWVNDITKQLYPSPLERDLITPSGDTPPFREGILQQLTPSI